MRIPSHIGPSFRHPEPVEGQKTMNNEILKRGVSDIHFLRYSLNSGIMSPSTGSG